MSKRSIRQRTVLASLAASILAAPIAPSVSAQENKEKDSVLAEPNKVRGDEITPEQKRAVEKGLAWLAQRIQANGGQGNFRGLGGTPAVTSLAGLAFMQAGNLPGRGKYGKEVQLCLDYVLSCCQESGLIANDLGSGAMYGHGFATLFLAEVYGMTQDENVKEKLQKAIRLIQKSQNAEGGWRYNPVPYDADISVTICQVMALRAARDAGIKVEEEVIKKSIEYVRNCQNPDGGFSYQANRGGSGGSGFPRSAAGVAALYYAGIFEGKEIENGLKYVKQFEPVNNRQVMDEGHFFYGHYYAVQAMFLAGGEYWASWYPNIRESLIRRQSPGGEWDGDGQGSEYGTSMALIILQMPNRYLPVYVGKGPGG